MKNLVCYSLSLLLQRLMSGGDIVARPDKIPRISYTNFAKQITDKFGIVCENWPLPKFCALGDMSSTSDLELLIRAWENGVTKFR